MPALVAGFVMHHPLILAISAMILMGAADAVSRRSRQLGASVGFYMLAQSPFFVLTAVVASTVLGEFDFSPVAWGFGSLSAALAFAATVLLLKSLRYGDASVNVTVFRMSFVFSSAAVFLLFPRDEPLTMGKAAGMLTAAVAIGLFSFGVAERGEFERRSLLYAVLGMAVASCMQVTWAWAAKSGVAPASFLLIQSLVFAVPTAVYALWLDEGEFTRSVWKYAPVNGVLMACGTLAAVASMARGQATVAIPITQLSFVVTAALSFALLRERMSGRKLAGCALAIVAVVLLGLR